MAIQADEQPQQSGSQSQEMPTVHRRVNVSYSVKGVATTDATFSIDGPTLPEGKDGRDFAAESTEFFNWVNKTWPPPVEVTAPPKPDEKPVKPKTGPANPASPAYMAITKEVAT